MAKIAIGSAPPTALPQRFLLTAPAWGCAAGLLLAIDGASALQTRWAPETLALVHLLTLGLLGNAMFGSLLQFLPAAAGVRVRGGVRSGWLLHALLNLGTLLLAAGLHAMQPRLLLGAAVLLGAAFGLLALLLLPGLAHRIAAGLEAARGRGRAGLPPGGDGGVAADTAPAARQAAAEVRATVNGIAFALLAALVTAALGVAMLLRIAGYAGLPLLPWIDVHAAWGVLGWCLGLLAAVGSVVVPMFQGTGPVSARARRGWGIVLAATLLAGAYGGAFGTGLVPVRWGGALCLAAFALAGLWLQWRAPRSRNPWLVHAWRAGLAALLGAGAVLAAGGSPVLLGTLVLAIALPWLVAGMQLEIVAFLGWIELHRRCGRGVRLPSVQGLLPESHKAGVFVLQALTALALLVAATWPDDGAARAAGGALAASQGVLWLRLRGVGRRVRDFHARAGRPGLETVRAG